jgi:hypothetical protein
MVPPGRPPPLNVTGQFRGSCRLPGERRFGFCSPLEERLVSYWPNPPHGAPVGLESYNGTAGEVPVRRHGLEGPTVAGASGTPCKPRAHRGPRPFWMGSDGPGHQVHPPSGEGLPPWQPLGDGGLGPLGVGVEVPAVGRRPEVFRPHKSIPRAVPCVATARSGVEQVDVEILDPSIAVHPVAGATLHETGGQQLRGPFRFAGRQASGARQKGGLRGGRRALPGDRSTYPLAEQPPVATAIR